jgi:hypothetical protein
MSESPASYMIKVLSLSKLLNSDENLDPRYKAGNLISTYLVPDKFVATREEGVELPEPRSKVL